MIFLSDSPNRKQQLQRGINLMEMLIVISVIATLTAISVPGYKAVVDTARAAKDTTNLRGLVNAAYRWASDNAEKLPSPKYPGGHQGEPPSGWDFAQTGTGLWCDGTLFGVVYEDAADEEGNFDAPESRATSGGHLVDTIFASEASVKSDPSELNYYRHTYAMNANLQYDRIHELSNTPDPWLTEKTASNLSKQSQALFLVDCIEENVIMAEDVGLIIEAAEERRRDYALGAFLDGHVSKLRPRDIPKGDIETSEEGSAFWRGVPANDE